MLSDRRPISRAEVTSQVIDLSPKNSSTAVIVNWISSAFGLLRSEKNKRYEDVTLKSGNRNTRNPCVHFYKMNYQERDGSIIQIYCTCSNLVILCISTKYYTNLSQVILTSLQKHCDIAAYYQWHCSIAALFYPWYFVDRKTHTDHLFLQCEVNTVKVGFSLLNHKHFPCG